MYRIVLLPTACLLIFLPHQVASSQTVQENLYGTNGPVSAIAVSGNTIFLGGSFTQVGLCTGGLARLDTVTGIADRKFPKVAGQVFTMLEDGSGGWYVGGSFTSIGGVPRNSLAHLRSDMSVESGWDPNVIGSVYALALSGDTLFVGGDFSSIGGFQSDWKSCLLSVRLSSGALNHWNPAALGTVKALAVIGRRLYVAGEFQYLGAQDTLILGGDRPFTRGLAAVDVSTAYRVWSSDTDADGIVESMLIANSTMYFGGRFSSVKGEG